MHPILILLNIAAAVMLLLWAVRMVRTGVERASGPALRRALRNARGGAAGMAAAGAVLAVVLQSSTAVGVLAAGFATSGILTVSAGIAALVGADFGSALVAKLLSFDLGALIPVLLLVGATLFLKFDGRQVRQGGRIVLGIGFILMALQMLGAATEPMRHTELLPQIVGYLRGDPITAFATAALLAWALHSSVATVLLLVAFAGQGILPLEVAVPMLLGANLGAGLIAVWLTRSDPREARLIPIGNLIVRGTGAALGLVLVSLVTLPMDRLGVTEGGQLVNLHLGFNLLMVLCAIPVIGPVERLANLILPEKTEPEIDAAPRPVSALDREAMRVPALAMASAKREILRMGETIETMFRPVIDILDSGRPEAIALLRNQEDEVNRTHTEIKLYIAELGRRGLDEAESQRGTELTGVAINLEHIGDLISKGLVDLAEKKKARGLSFSPEGWSEITTLHARVLANMQLAMNVLVSDDVESARVLVQEKEVLRKLERESHERHLARLRSGKLESIETSGLHLEAVRALKEINSLLVTVAYPILAETGQLLKSRLAPSG